MKINWYMFKNPNLFPDYQTEDFCTQVCITHYGAIQYVENQTEAICWAAILNNINNIEYIKNPTNAMWKVVIAESPGTIVYHPNPSVLLCEYAIRISPAVIRQFKNPPLSLTLLSYDISTEYGSKNIDVNQLINIINANDVIDEEIWKRAIDEYEYNLKVFGKKQTMEMCMYTFNEYVLSVSYLKLSELEGMIQIPYSEEFTREINKFKILNNHW